MPVGEHWSKARDMKDRHARMGAKADVEALYEQIQSIGRAYPGLLDEMEREARPGNLAPPPAQTPPTSNGAAASPPLLDASAADPEVTKRQRISNALKGRKQPPEVVAKRVATRLKNIAASKQADKPPSKRGRPRKAQ
jgi:hypothetical protein